MSNIGPIHPFEGQQFRLVTAQSLAVDAAAIAIVLGGAYTFYRRLRLGGLILAVTIALMPVLNLLPIAFNEDLYHDRYATTALAIACALLPSLLIPILAHGRSRVPVTCIALVAGVWLAFAVINIRVTVPLWTDELTLWQWALRENPGSATARNRLLSLYINRGDSPHARALADALIVDNPRCASCMLNAAYAALNDGDAARAQNALDKLKDSDVLVYNSRFLRGYILANGELFELRHDEVGAEAAYRDAIKLEEYDPAPQMALASLLAKQGKILEARAAAEAALPLFTPDERIKRRQEFERGLGNPAPADRP
jgi:tetratricopeptide (TPR) repeat protein